MICYRAHRTTTVVVAINSRVAHGLTPTASLLEDGVAVVVLALTETLDDDDICVDVVELPVVTIVVELTVGTIDVDELVIVELSVELEYYYYYSILLLSPF